jgi:hypothetical protein
MAVRPTYGAWAMITRLRDDLHFCICSGRTVFLDVRADRYFQLPIDLDLAFQRLASGRTALPSDKAALDAIISRGWIINADQGGRPLLPEATPSPTAEIAPLPSLARITDRMKVLALIQMARFDLVRQPFQTLLERMSRSTAALGEGEATDWTSLDHVAAAFAAIGTIIQRQDRCLPMSIAFKRLCLSRGIRATLVIGVKLDPFVAHCWIQRDECVVNDTLERARLFAPILAV